VTAVGTIHLESGNPEMFDEYAELYNAVNSFDNQDHMDLSGEYFQSIYSTPIRNLDSDIVLVRSSCGDLIGSGIAFPHDNSPTSMRIEIQVHPEHRKQGIGSCILKRFLKNEQNQNRAELVCRIFNFRPYSVAFALKHGFMHDHTWIKMKFANNSRAQSTLLSWKFKIRTLDTTTELDLWADLQNRIFAGSPLYNNTTAEKLGDLINHNCFDPNLVVVGEVEKTPIGVCMGWSFQSRNNRVNEKILQIQGLGILPKYRREGYASSLLIELMRRAYLKAHVQSELLVLSTNESAIRMYKKIGFREKYAHLWYHRKL
jgi:ribosomal protein S18 acetylase RimI-like enzyme